MGKRGYRQSEHFVLRQRGIILSIVLLVITLMIVVMSVVVRQSLGSLHQAKLAGFSKQSLFAAEAGAADAMRRLVEAPAWEGPIPSTTMESGSSYSALITNNFSGPGEQTASNGAKVPQGMAYVLATGQQSSGGVKRRVGVLVSPSSVSSLGIAIGVGGMVDMGGSKRIFGSVKANGNIEFSGSTRIAPVGGSGRVLSSSDVDTGGSMSLDETQDVLARGEVRQSPPIRGAYLVTGGDGSASTDQFIADGRLDNSLLPGEKGQVLPNPDPATLLAPATLVPYATVAPGPEIVNYDLNLDGKVHYFPYGVTFTGSSNVTGPGTIVVGNGSTMEFSGSTRDLEANLIALDAAVPPSPPTGGGTIRFQGNTSVRGLIYAHEDVIIQGNFDLEGMVIAYRDGGGDLISQGSTKIRLDPSALADVPGFEAWASGFGGVGGLGGTSSLSVRVWERF